MLARLALPLPAFAWRCPLHHRHFARQVGHRALAYLVVVESFTALWWRAQAGIAHPVALMGASCSERQAELVRELVPEDGRIWVLADGDPAGERMAESTMKLLAPHRSCDGSS